MIIAFTFVQFANSEKASSGGGGKKRDHNEKPTKEKHEKGQQLLFVLMQGFPLHKSLIEN